MIPPTISALFPSKSPNFLPKYTPVADIRNVVIPISEIGMKISNINMQTENFGVEDTVTELISCRCLVHMSCH